VKELLEELKSLGIEQTETPVGVKKRLSDGSTISAGGSSGYLGGSSSGITSSSGSSSQRSRLSIAPETKIEKHSVIPPLPSVPINNCKDTVSSASDDKDVTENAKQQKEEESSESTPPPESAAVSLVKTPGKRGRKRKDATAEGKEKINKKVLTKKKDDNIAKDSASVNEDLVAGVDDKYAVNSKVFARWGDSTGVYYYPAAITQIINNEQVKVMFIEDKIKKPLKKETEIVTVGQLRPGMSVTVKHDIYSVYEVTAILTKYPTKRGSDIEYEVKISATDSEPGNNEEVRQVTHSDITLTDSQAGEILRDTGVTLASTTISGKIDLSNLIFSKRKTRGGAVTPSSSDVTAAVKTPRRKRGGDNCEDSAATTHESSAAEISPRKTPRSTRLTTPTPRLQRRLLQSTDEDDFEDVEEVKKSQTSSSRRDSKAKTEIFWGLSFILTHSKESAPSPTEAEQYDSLSDNDKDVSKSVVHEPKFDKKALRSAITAHGGNIVTEVSEDSLDTTLVGVSDKECKTMNFLQCLAHGVPLVSHIYILDCVRSGKLLERAAYLLPAGFSVLLMKNVEQGQDYKTELQCNGCLLPYPPATGTRQSARVKAEDAVNHRKVLSGLHVLVISTDRHFTEDWQSVLVSLGASVTGVYVSDTRLRDIRPPDVVVTDSKAPSFICKDVDQHDVPIVSTNWIIQCTVNNARIAFNNFRCKLPI